MEDSLKNISKLINFDQTIIFLILVTTVLVPKTFSKPDVENRYMAELDPIIYSSKQERTSSQTSDSYEIYNVTDIDEQGMTSVTDLLDSMSGLEVNKTGLLGGSSSVFIRGGESKHTLILIDGVRFTDPTNISRTVNLFQLNGLDIERIEVLKGPQSVLYGSDAISGVINIITKKGASKNSLKVSTGYYNEFALDQSISLGETLINLNGFYRESNYGSVASSGDEIDSTFQKGATLGLISEKGPFEFSTKLKMGENFFKNDGFDSITYLAADDLQAYGKNRYLFLSESIIYTFSKKTKLFFELSYNKMDREDRYYYGQYITTKSDGSTLNLETRAMQTIGLTSFVYGLNTVKETYRTDSVKELVIETKDIFVNASRSINENEVSLGVRTTSHGDFGLHTIGSLGISREFIKNNRIRFSLKSGYKAPSAYELYAPANQYGPQGNDELQPEKTKGVELSYTVNSKTSSANVWSHQVAAFYNEVESSISSVYLKGYQNTGEIITRGIEFGSDYRMGKHKISTDLVLVNHTNETGKKVSRRANYEFATIYSLQLNDTREMKLHHNLKGRRFSINNKEMHPYDTTDLSLSERYKDYLFSMSIKNIFDREYEVAEGYSVLRQAMEISIKYTY